MTIEKILNSKIKENGYKINEFIKELGFTKQNYYYHIRNLKNNKITFTSETLIKIKKILGIDLLNFFN